MGNPYYENDTIYVEKSNFSPLDMKLRKLEEIVQEIGRLVCCGSRGPVFLNVTKEKLYSIKILRVTTQKSNLGKTNIKKCSLLRFSRAAKLQRDYAYSRAPEKCVQHKGMKEHVGSKKKPLYP